jgi:hypothetical protein
MTGSILKKNGLVAKREDGLLRKYRYTAFLFYSFRIKKSVPVVYTAGRFYLPGPVKDRFAQSSLARVNVGKYSYTYILLRKAQAH